MKTIEILTAIIIYLVIPAFGVLLFLQLVKQIKKNKISDAPLIPLFILFATYGGLLMIILTSVVFPLQWSGAASLGIFYLVLVAPILLGIIAIRFTKKKIISKYHHWVFRASALYFIVCPIALAALYQIIVQVENNQIK
jgi:uncharacterized membrane protein